MRRPFIFRIFVLAFSGLVLMLFLGACAQVSSALTQSALPAAATQPPATENELLSEIPSSATAMPTEAMAFNPPTGLIAYLDLDHQLWLMNTDGQNRHQLTQGGEASVPAWSPDGQTLAYIYQEKGSKERQVVLYDISNQTRRFIGPAGEWLSQVVWSPDGRYLALDSGTGIARSLRIVEVADQQVVRELEAIGYAWSPDGSWLALGQRHPLEHPLSVEPLDSVDLAVLKLDQEAPQLILEGTPHVLYFPRSWLPDGRLVYEKMDWDEESQEGDRSLLAISFEEGHFGEPQPVEKLPPAYDRDAVLMRLPAEFRDIACGTFSWSPDGHWIAFHAGEWPAISIYLFNWAKGAPPHRLIEGVSPRWQPLPEVP